MAAAVNVRVEARRNEPPDRLIKRFNKKVRREGIIEESRDRMYYEKPSVKKARRNRQRKRTLEKLKREQNHSV